MATVGSFNDDPLPTSEQVAEVTKFLAELEGLTTKLEGKKLEARKVIQSKMSDLHQLIDKWETRFLDTMAETLDEKIETINKQHDKLKSTVDWIKDQRKTKRMSRVFPSAMRASPAPVANEADTEEGLQKAMVDPAVDDEEVPEQPEEEDVKKHWRVWKALKFPLQPAGVTPAEVKVDLWNEFGPILEESRKSLKRSMLFVGGIVRAYMRRGHKKDEWVAMVRRLEARVEATPHAPGVMTEGSFVIENNANVNANATGVVGATNSSSSSNILSSSSSAAASASLGSVFSPGGSSAYSAIVSTIWMAISDIYKYRAVPSVKGPLTKQLNYMYANYPMFVEFYLPQLSNLLLCNKDFPLAEFIFDCCRAEPHFAIQTYFLISSMSQVGPAKWQKRCIKTLKQIIKAIPAATLSGKSQIIGKKSIVGGLEGSAGSVGGSVGGSTWNPSNNSFGGTESSSSSPGPGRLTSPPINQSSIDSSNQNMSSSINVSVNMVPIPGIHSSLSSIDPSTTPESTTPSLRTTTSSLNVSSGNEVVTGLLGSGEDIQFRGDEHLSQTGPHSSTGISDLTQRTSSEIIHENEGHGGLEHVINDGKDEFEDDEESHILSEFPLGLPTDNHHLMLLLSPRNSSSIPIPRPGSIEDGEKVLNMNSPLLFPSLTDDNDMSSKGPWSTESPHPAGWIARPIPLHPGRGIDPNNANSILSSQQIDAEVSKSSTDASKESLVGGNGSSSQQSGLESVVQSQLDSSSSHSHGDGLNRTSSDPSNQSSNAIPADSISSLHQRRQSGVMTMAPQITLTTSASQLKTGSGRVSPKPSIPAMSSSIGDDGYRGDDNKSDDDDDEEKSDLSSKKKASKAITPQMVSFSTTPSQIIIPSDDGFQRGEEDDEKKKSNSFTSKGDSSKVQSHHIDESNQNQSSITDSRPPKTSAIPIPRSSSPSSIYKAPPEHLYMYSPMNESPTIIPEPKTIVTSSTVSAMELSSQSSQSQPQSSHSQSQSSQSHSQSSIPISTSNASTSSVLPSGTTLPDLTSEIKAAVTAAAAVVARETKNVLPNSIPSSLPPSSSTLPLSTTHVSSDPVSSKHHPHMKPSRKASGDRSGEKSVDVSKSSSSSSVTGKAKKHLSVPNDHHPHPHSGDGDAATGSISDSYNSDDPEQELKKLTRIVKPPSAPRVEKNLEVPAGKEYFFTQIKFMRKLIDVSRKLGELYGKPELYKPQLDRELEALSPYIDSGFAYIPTQNGVRTRVLRFALADCHPIQTYGRVLYRMIMEVVDLPAHYSKEMADEYVRLTKDIRRMSSPPDHGNQVLESESSSSMSSGPSGGSNQMSHSGAIQPPSSKPSSGKYLPNKGLVVSASLPAVMNASGSIGNVSSSGASVGTPSSSVASVNSGIASSTEDGTSYAFGDAWKDVRRRLKSQSMYSALPHWDVRAYIVKHGDLVLQEQFVMQLLVQFQHIWDLEGLPLKLNLYSILATSYQSGLIEVVPNSISLDKLKKVTEAMGDPNMSLADFFKRHWGKDSPEELKRARSNFISSLAAYSVVCYLLQIKDRHNGNIMLDADGRIFHIDFGYLLARTIKFERAPFKLTDEFIEVLGGDQSKYFKTYTNLCVLGFLAARKHYEKIVLLVEMSSGEGSAIPCLEGDSVAHNLRSRFHLDWTEQECEEYFLEIIGEARDNWRTQIYDTYQRIVNDIH